MSGTNARLELAHSRQRVLFGYALGATAVLVAGALGFFSGRSEWLQAVAIQIIEACGG